MGTLLSRPASADDPMRGFYHMKFPTKPRRTRRRPSTTLQSRDRNKPGFWQSHPPTPAEARYTGSNNSPGPSHGGVVHQRRATITIVKEQNGGISASTGSPNTRAVWTRTGTNGELARSAVFPSHPPPTATPKPDSSLHRQGRLKAFFRRYFRQRTNYAALPPSSLEFREEQIRESMEFEAAFMKDMTRHAAHRRLRLANYGLGTCIILVLVMVIWGNRLLRGKYRRKRKYSVRRMINAVLAEPAGMHSKHDLPSPFRHWEQSIDFRPLLLSLIPDPPLLLLPLPDPDLLDLPFLAPRSRRPYFFSLETQKREIGYRTFLALLWIWLAFQKDQRRRRDGRLRRRAVVLAIEGPNRIGLNALPTPQAAQPRYCATSWSRPIQRSLSRKERISKMGDKLQVVVAGFPQRPSNEAGPRRWEDMSAIIASTITRFRGRKSSMLGKMKVKMAWVRRTLRKKRGTKGKDHSTQERSRTHSLPSTSSLHTQVSSGEDTFARDSNTRVDQVDLSCLWERSRKYRESLMSLETLVNGTDEPEATGTFSRYKQVLDTLKEEKALAVAQLRELGYAHVGQEESGARDLGEGLTEFRYQEWEKAICDVEELEKEVLNMDAGLMDGYESPTHSSSPYESTPQMPYSASFQFEFPIPGDDPADPVASAVLAMHNDPPHTVQIRQKSNLRKVARGRALEFDENKAESHWMNWEVERL